MVDDEFKVAWEPLSKFTIELFTRVGLPPEDAKTGRNG